MMQVSGHKVCIWNEHSCFSSSSSSFSVSDETSGDFEFSIQRRLAVRSRDISYDACFGINTANERVLTVLAVIMYLTSLIMCTALETAICLNPPTHSFTGNKKLDIFYRPTLKCVTFLRKYKEKQLFVGTNIFTEGLFVTQLSSNAGISFWRIV